MTNKIPCEVIRDLFPSYIDGLTSEVTNEVMEEHLEHCDACARSLEAMMEFPEEKEDAAQEREIDFLKKTRKNTRRIVVGSIVAAVIFVAVVLTAKFYFIGNDISADAVACEVAVSGNCLNLTVETVNESLAVSSLEFEEQDGVVSVSVKAVKKSPFHRGEVQSLYTVEGEITQIRIGDRILWDHGEIVSAFASNVFQSRHPYIGNMSENGDTVRTLQMVSHLGNFKNELQTKEEPYSWKLLLENEIPALQRELKEDNMRAYAYVFLAVIDNLGEVSFEYTVDGNICLLVVTSEEASAFAGCDIKKCGQDVLLLQELLRKSGLESNF